MLWANVPLSFISRLIPAGVSASVGPSWGWSWQGATNAKDNLGNWFGANSNQGKLGSPGDGLVQESKDPNII